jgi:integrin beta 2
MCKDCKCRYGYKGARCEKKIEEMSQDMKSATAIVVPIIALCLIILLVILGIYIYRKRANRQFKHMRMAEPGAGNVEITNPMYLRDYDDEEGGDVGDAFTFDPDKPTNFSNPMYDTLYNENAAELMSPDNEKNQLLKDDNSKVQFFGDEERQPLGSSKA